MVASRKYEITNTIFQKKAGGDGHGKAQTKTEIDSILRILKARHCHSRNSVINQVNIGSDHGMVMSNIKWT